MSNIVYVVETSENGVLGVFNSVHKAGDAAVNWFTDEDRADLLRALRYRAYEFQAMETGETDHISFIARTSRRHASVMRMEVQ